MRFFRWLAAAWQATFSKDCHFCAGTGVWQPWIGWTVNRKYPDLKPGPCAHCQGTGRVWLI